jgi:endonuclease/exonuclease/phosphatase (EEP) superfamily protein YafD
MDTDERANIEARKASRVDGTIRFVRRVAFWGAIGVCALLTLLHLFVSDRTWWGELVTIWPPLLWLFGLIPLCAIAFDWRRWRRSLTPVVAVALFLLLTAPWRFHVLPPVPSPEDGARRVRLATWNVAGSWPHEEETIRQLRGMDLDLCLIQESPDGVSPVALLPALDHWINAGDCAIFSRWPMRELPTRDVGPWEDPLIVAFDDLGVAAINVRLMLPSLRLNIFSGPAREQMRRDHAARVGQFEELAALIESLESEGFAVILAGDFNTPGRMASLDPLRGKLRDVWRLSGEGWGGTATNSFPMARIDQCWVSEAITPMRAEVESFPHSDHRMLVVDLAAD